MPYFVPQGWPEDVTEIYGVVAVERKEQRRRKERSVRGAKPGPLTTPSFQTPPQANTPARQHTNIS